MTDLEQRKINFADASISLEIAQARYNEAKQLLIQALQNPPIPKPPIVEIKPKEIKKTEVK